MPVNRNILRLEIARQSETVLRVVKPQIEDRFEEIKQDMLNDYDDRQVTKSLRAGPDGSDGLVTTGGRGGNLYSFLGFNQGENPAEVVREILDENTRINMSQIRRVVRPNEIEFRAPVKSPSLTELHDKAGKRLKLEWTSRSFSDLIERGITGFSHYLYKINGEFGEESRSGKAVQAKNALRTGSFGGIRWVSSVLSKFRKSVTR